jgi:hypothetical protein
MTKIQRNRSTTIISWLASAFMVASVVSGCSGEAKGLDPRLTIPHLNLHDQRIEPAFFPLYLLSQKQILCFSFVSRGD